MNVNIDAEVIDKEKKHTMPSRLEGIELLRMVSMFMILLLHYCGKGNFLIEKPFANNNAEIAWIIEAFSIVAVNCYVLISGYFLVYSHCEGRKVIKIIGQVLFYSIGIYLLFRIALPNLELPFYKKLTFFLPITLKTYWFATCYVVLYLLAPFINIILKIQHKKS